MRSFIDIMEAAQGGTFTVYHGTAADFQGFENNQLGSAHGRAPINMTGFNFTDNPECAATFGPNVLKCQVTIARPYVIDAEGESYTTFKHIINDHLYELDKPSKRKKFDGLIITDYADAGIHGDDYIVSTHYIPFTKDQIKIIDRKAVDTPR
jgi:hypothetical protein